MSIGAGSNSGTHVRRLMGSFVVGYVFFVKRRRGLGLWWEGWLQVGWWAHGWPWTTRQTVAHLWYMC